MDNDMVSRQRKREIHDVKIDWEPRWVERIIGFQIRMLD